MQPDSDVEDALGLVSKRCDVLALLDGERVPKRRIEAELECSRSTVNRAVAALSDAGLVNDAPGGCRTTVVGSLLLEQYEAYVRAASDVLEGREVLESLPPGADFDPSVLADAEVSTPGGSSPYEAYHAFEALLGAADDRVRVYVPAFTNPRGIELARDLAERVDLELVFDADLLGELRNDTPDAMTALFDLEGVTGYETTAGPDYTVAVVDAESETKGGVVVHTPEKELAGVIVTSDPDATRWLERRFSEIRADSERLDGLA
ncbi:helix-turn-helix transcriptional regulator [Natronomonas marina]|jgi:predicted transcriptional regulator|uniref:helix-turn-helix transcriptional regulator n=1 Tax=Natronomonas marina TaxID=2961939 RepID=UPI0020C9769A|nr:hypothetical protein [Natronomonas marina]